MAFLHQILQRKQTELAAAKKLRSLSDLKNMIGEAPALRSFSSALRNGFGLIAEIKRKSPSAGEMRKENVAEAPAAYARCPVVKAVSVLTNSTDFGMGIEELARIKSLVPQPVLRKDFIFDEYQIYEARAFGADALLLMANVLERDRMQRLFELSRELNLDVLFEAHTREEIESIPAGASIYGINSRNFMASNRWHFAKLLTSLGLSNSCKGPDFSVQLQTFALIEHLPKTAIKVAESGVKPAKIAELIKLGYNAVLVGTSLLKASEGIGSILHEFEQALAGAPQKALNQAGQSLPA